MTLTFMLIAALVCEALMETIKTIYEQGKVNWNRVLAILLGILVCMAFNIDLFTLLGFVSSVPFIGTILTGIMISRGANFVHDLFKIIQEFKNVINVR